MCVSVYFEVMFWGSLHAVHLIELMEGIVLQARVLRLEKLTSENMLINIA